MTHYLIDLLPACNLRSVLVSRWLCGLGFVCAMLSIQPAVAQPVPATTPTHVVQLSASGYLEVPQDWLSMHLSTIREGADPASVQAQLKTALDAALSVARLVAQPRLMEIRTGPFGLYPRYANNGKISGWQGSASLILEGRDFDRITTTVGKIQTLTLAQTEFSLSRDAQRQLESDVQAMAIERFKVRADEVARAFGFQGYVLREVSISSADQESARPYPRSLALQAKTALADAPVPVEAGKSNVNITVSGSVQLR